MTEAFLFDVSIYLKQVLNLFSLYGNDGVLLQSNYNLMDYCIFVSKYNMSLSMYILYIIGVSN